MWDRALLPFFFCRSALPERITAHPEGGPLKAAYRHLWEVAFLAKIAWVFPGQGAQFVGMGKELYKEFPQARSVFDSADRVLKRSLSEIMFQGPGEELTLTYNAQPALLTVEVACTRILQANGLQPDVVAGLSLGEYSALVVADSLDFEEAVMLTYKRGVYMQEACPPGRGAMAAILGLTCAEVEALCFESKDTGVVLPANYNCPGQTVISGEKSAVEHVARKAQERGIRTIPLAVSAPFHSPLMKSAANKLEADLLSVAVRAPIVPVYSNVHGEILTSSESVRSALIKQVTSPVLWQVCVESMIRDGAGAFVEVGPGKSLAGFGKRISPGMPYASFSSPRDLDSVLAFTEEALLT